ncbi:MAG TPA: hypothetical protein GXX36_12830 [Clostridiaceae bacterium]|nr:hypothetical protein [Clostridiaceae bacterium]
MKNKNNVFRNAVVAGTLCAFIAVPSFVQAANIRPILAEDVKPIIIYGQYNHWSKPYIEKLLKNYNVESIFKDKDLESYIKEEEYKNIVKLVIDEEYDGSPDAMTREAVVYDLMKLWAKKTGQDLDNIAVIQMLIYSDTDKIDAKYNHAITLAYLKNIAKGNGGGIFNPKAKVTYGELAALISNTHEAIKNELSFETDSIMEGRFETKAGYEIKDGKMTFDFELISHYTETKNLLFGSGQQFEITITDEKGEEVYRYSDDKFFTMAIVTKSINPGESLKWQDTWDMTNKDGEKLTSGKYKAKIDILVIPEEDGEKIDPSQLTTEIEFDLSEAK